MWQCSKCGADVANSHDTCWICGTSIDGVARAGLPPPRVSPSLAPTLFSVPALKKPPRPQVGLPRRFGIGTMMILTAAFALLFGILKTLKAPPVVFAGISVYVAGVAACQVLLYKGKNPRKASFVGGMILFALIGVVAVIVVHLVDPRIFGGAFVGPLFAAGVEAVIFGGPLGYLVGCLIASIFLVRKEPDDAEPPAKEPAERGP